MSKLPGGDGDHDKIAVLYFSEAEERVQEKVIMDLEYVINSGFDDVYILSTQPKTIDGIVNASISEELLKNTKLHLISEEAHSTADVFRTLDNMSVISTEFVFLNGPRRINAPLLPFLEKHKATVKKDKNTILTLAYTFCKPGHPERTTENEQVLIVDINRKVRACLDGATKVLHIASDVTESGTANIRFDLVSSGVYICTPKIPALFTENFDFHDMKDLIKHALMEDEVATSNIYLEEVQGLISLDDLRNHFESDGDLFLPPSCKIQDDHHYDSESASESEDDDYDEERERAKELEAFFREVFESLERGFHEKLKPNDLILEINGSRYAYNVPVDLIGAYVMKAILTLNTQIVGSKDVSAQLEHLKRILKGLSSVLKNYVSDSKLEEQENCLKLVEEYCNTEPIVLKYAQRLLHQLYEEEILASESIVQWHVTINNIGLKTGIDKFVEWLREEDDDDDSEESESD